MAPKKKVRREAQHVTKGAASASSLQVVVPQEQAGGGGPAVHVLGGGAAGASTEGAAATAVEVGPPPSPFVSSALLQRTLTLVGLFAPHLSDRDLCALSLTATWLLPYRLETTQLAICLPRGAHHKASLETLLRKRPKVHTLTVRAAQARPAVLRALKEGSLPRLTNLSFRGVRMVDVRSLVSAMKAGALRRLAKLDLTENQLPPDRMKSLMQALSEGTMIDLRSLIIGCNFVSGDQLGAALEKGCCPRLQELGLAGIRTFDVKRVASALRHGSCPDLRILDLSSVRSLINLPELMSAFGSGTCGRNMQDLRFTDAILSHHDMTALATAMQAGACPDLVHLRLGYILWDDSNAQCLARAVTGRVNCKLESLSLGGRAVLQEGMEHLAEVLRGGALPRLKTLDMSDLELEVDDIQALLGAFRDHACPAVEVINFGDNWFDGPDGPTSLTQAIQNGAMQELKELYLNRCSLDSEAMVNFFESMAVAGLARLTTLSLMENHIGNPGVISLCDAVKRGVFPCLQVLVLNHVGMGSSGARALATVWEEGFFRELTDLEIGMNPVGNDGLMALIDAWTTTEGAGSKVTTLRISDCDLGQRSINALANALNSYAHPILPRLGSLYLGNNGVSETALGHLMKALIRPERGAFLEKMNLMGCSVGDTAISMFAKAAREGHGGGGLKKLELATNRIGSQGISELITALENGGLPSLVSLDLACNPVSRDPDMLHTLTNALDAGKERLSPGSLLFEDLPAPRACFFQCSIQ